MTEEVFAGARGVWHLLEEVHDAAMREAEEGGGVEHGSKVDRPERLPVRREALHARPVHAVKHGLPGEPRVERDHVVTFLRHQLVEQLLNFRVCHQSRTFQGAFPRRNLQVILAIHCSYLKSDIRCKTPQYEQLCTKNMRNIAQ